MTPLPQLSSDQLQSLGAHALHKIACSAVGTLTTYRLILGRCLLAMQRSENFREFGCSGAVHYAVSRLGLADWQAREHLRIARQLENLPQMTQAAEHGWLAWSTSTTIAVTALFIKRAVGRGL